MASDLSVLYANKGGVQGLLWAAPWNQLLAYTLSHEEQASAAVFIERGGLLLKNNQIKLRRNNGNPKVYLEKKTPPEWLLVAGEEQACVYV